MIALIVWLVIVGVCLYIVNTVVPMPEWIKTVINVIVALAVVLWLLEHVAGVSTGIHLR